jgi:hypothetical protein
MEYSDKGIVKTKGREKEVQGEKGKDMNLMA